MAFRGLREPHPHHYRDLINLTRKGVLAIELWQAGCFKPSRRISWVQNRELSVGR